MNQPIAARRAFRLFLLARVFTSLSFQMAGVAVGWLVYARTGSAYNLGLIGLAQFLPMVALTFVVGPLADRVDRRRIVAGCEILNVATLVVLALGAASDWLTMPVIFAAVALLGAARAFEHPSMSALLPNVVGESDLPRAVAFSSSAMQTATIIGPALGGLLYAFGASAPLGLAAAMSGATCLVILAVPLERKPLKNLTLRSTAPADEYPSARSKASSDLRSQILRRSTTERPSTPRRSPNPPRSWNVVR